MSFIVEEGHDLHAELLRLWKKNGGWTVNHGGFIYEVITYGDNQVKFSRQRPYDPEKFYADESFK